jgi:hypothetical protein
MRSRVGFAVMLVTGLVISTAQAETRHLVRAMTFPGDGEGGTPPQTSFAPDTPKITLGVQIQDLDPGAEIKANWIAEKADGAPENYQIDSATISAGDVTGDVIAFRLSRPNAGWPAGEYRVDVSYDGHVELSQHFSVVGHR